jgi:hypothetical protein
LISLTLQMPPTRQTAPSSVAWRGVAWSARGIIDGLLIGLCSAHWCYLLLFSHVIDTLMRLPYKDVVVVRGAVQNKTYRMVLLRRLLDRMQEARRRRPRQGQRQDEGWERESDAVTGNTTSNQEAMRTRTGRESQKKNGRTNSAHTHIYGCI